MHRLWLSDISVPVGNQITNTVAPTAFTWALPWPANIDSPGNADRTLKIKAFGYLSSKSATPGTLQLTLLWGATALGATIAFTPPVSLANAGWSLDAIIKVCTTGTSGKVSCQGMFLLDNAGAAVTAGIVNTGLTTTGQITVNTQTAQNIALQAAFSLADVANIITLSEMVIEEVG